MFPDNVIPVALDIWTRRFKNDVDGKTSDVPSDTPNNIMDEQDTDEDDDELPF